MSNSINEFHNIKNDLMKIVKKASIEDIIEMNSSGSSLLMVLQDLQRLEKIDSIDWEELEDAINSIAGYSMEEHDVSRETVMATKEFIIVKRFIDTIKGEK